jgi:transposase
MYVAGIDAHATYLVVGVVSNTGQLVQSPTRIENSETEQLLELLKRFQPVEAVAETSPAWPWLYELLTEHGIGFVLAHAKKLRVIAEANYKTDEIDAEVLARMRVAGLIPEVYAKPANQREHALLVRHRTRLVRTRTAATGRIHAELHAVGLRLPRGRLLTVKGRKDMQQSAWPRFGTEQRRLVETHFALIDHLGPMIRDLDARIERTGREIPAVQLLRTVPGIGAYRGLLIATEVLPIERFPTPAHLVSYAGLAPRSRKSGLAPMRHGSIPAGVNRWLRGTLVQAVVTHVQKAPDSWLAHYYTVHKKRLGWQTARVATARKLARAVHAMLRTGEMWQQGSITDERGELHPQHVA